MLRFDGRVAVVTGAGRGIGRAYALLLAERGARVVVNDLGGSVDGDGNDAGPAAEVVTEVIAAGGSALADTNDISKPAGGEALIAAALDAFGRIDIVVNNAGIMRWAQLPELDHVDLDAHIAVHVGGSFHTSRAAWPHMAAQGYGRIVNTASAGVFGIRNNTAYATAKGGVIGLSRNMALTGAKLGIKVNVIAPAAMTRMAKEPSDDDMGMPPELVAPMVAYLAHEHCPVTGQIYAAGANRFSRIMLISTPGYLHADGAATIEDVAANFDTVNSTDGWTAPANLMEWSAEFTAHLRPTQASLADTGRKAVQK